MDTPAAPEPSYLALTSFLNDGVLDDDLDELLSSQAPDPVEPRSPGTEQACEDVPVLPFESEESQEVESRTCTPKTFEETVSTGCGKFAAVAEVPCPSSMRLAVLALDVHKVKDFIACGCSVNVPHEAAAGGGFTTLLHEACSVPSEALQPKALEIVTLLLEGLANVNPRNSAGMTPLHAACAYKHLAAVKLLMERRADAAVKDDSGLDSLLWSIVMNPENPKGRKPNKVSNRTNSLFETACAVQAKLFSKRTSSMLQVRTPGQGGSRSGRSMSCTPQSRSTSLEVPFTRGVSLSALQAQTRRLSNSSLESLPEGFVAYLAAAVAAPGSDCEQASEASSISNSCGSSSLCTAPRHQDDLELQDVDDDSTPLQTPRTGNEDIPQAPERSSSREYKFYPQHIDTEDDIRLGKVSAQLVQMHLERSGRLPKAVLEPESPVSPPVFKRQLAVHFDSIGTGDKEEQNEEVVTVNTALALATKHINHWAANVLLQYGAQARDYLHEAVRTASVNLVILMLEAQADPLMENEDSLSPMDLALQSQDRAMVQTLRNHSKCRMLQRFPSSSSGSASPTSQKTCSPRRRVSVRGFKEEMDAVKLRQAQEKSKESLLSKQSEEGGRTWDLLTRALLLSELLSGRARWILKQATFQVLIVGCLIVALFSHDLLVLNNQDSLATPDIPNLVVLGLFVAEFCLQAAAFQRSYLASSSCVTDVISTFSLLSDLIIDYSVQESASKIFVLVARCCRLVVLLKFVRYLPGFHQKMERNKLKLLTRKLDTTVGLIVCSVVILMIVIMLFWALGNFSDKDYAMAAWTEELSSQMQEQWSVDELELTVQDMLDFFSTGLYAPYGCFCAGPTVAGDNSTICGIGGTGSNGDPIYWKSDQPTRRQDIMEVRSGNLVVLFDLRGTNQVDLVLDLVLIALAVGLFMGVSFLVINSVTTLAMRPLNKLVLEVGRLGALLKTNAALRNVETPAAEGAQLEDGGGMDRSFSKEADIFTQEIKTLNVVCKKVLCLAKLQMSNQFCDVASEAKQLLGECNADDEESELRVVEIFSTRSSCRARPRVKLCEESAMLSYIIEAPDEDTALRKSVHDWEFNPRELEPLEGVVVCASLLDLVSTKAKGFEGQFPSWHSFCEEASKGYLTGPAYHCWAHGVDVTHVLFTMLRMCSRYKPLFTPLEEVALLAAATFHDVGHPGLSNDYLAQTSQEVARLYNDKSPLENFSCARLFEVANAMEVSVFGFLTRKDYNEVRSIIIEAILHTDNVQHLGIVKKIQVFLEVQSHVLECAEKAHSEAKVLLSKAKYNQSDESEVPAWPGKDLQTVLQDPETRVMLRNMVMHLADVSNAMRPFEVCKEWAVAIIEEFFAQGDLERQFGLPVGPLNDRSKVNLQSSQVGYIEFFMAPFAFAAVRLLRPLEDMSPFLLSNVKLWVQEWNEVMKPSKEELQAMEDRVARIVLKAPGTTAVKFCVGSSLNRTLTSKKTTGFS